MAGSARQPSEIRMLSHLKEERRAAVKVPRAGVSPSCARAASGALQAFASGDALGGEESSAASERETAEPVAAWLAALLSWRHPAAPLPPAAVAAWAASAPCATLLKVCAQTCKTRVQCVTRVLGALRVPVRQRNRASKDLLRACGRVSTAGAA